MNTVKETFIKNMPDEKADRYLVSISANAMLEKLNKKRLEGRSGWHNKSSNGELFKMLKEHMEKGDMIDIMNFAAMIYVRSELYGDKA